jgi:GTPase SAR1 family protein
MARNIYFIGTAGSGKSTMTAAFQEWMGDRDLDTVVMNLDPGAVNLAYEPDIDVRDWVKLEDIMDEYGLGPNGAQIMCADLVAVNIRELAEALETYKTNYVLIDTPGQMELFTFREASRAIVEAFGQEDSYLVFLSDASLARSPTGLLSLVMLSATTQFRFLTPLLNVLSKSDLLGDDDLETLLERTGDPYRLYNDLSEERGESAVTVELFKALENVGVYRTMIPVSARNMTGLEDIYNNIQQFFAGGEDLSKD